MTVTKNLTIISSKISKLPYYLSIQFVRFFWKADKQVKAKIARV